MTMINSWCRVKACHRCKRLQVGPAVNHHWRPGNLVQTGFHRYPASQHKLCQLAYFEEGTFRKICLSGTSPIAGQHRTILPELLPSVAAECDHSSLAIRPRDS